MCEAMYVFVDSLGLRKKTHLWMRCLSGVTRLFLEHQSYLRDVSIPTNSGKFRSGNEFIIKMKLSLISNLPS